MSKEEELDLERTITPWDLPCLLNPVYFCECQLKGINSRTLDHQTRILRKRPDYRDVFQRNGFYLNRSTLICLLVAPNDWHHSPCTELYLQFSPEIKEVFGEPLRETRRRFFENLMPSQKIRCTVYREYLKLISQPGNSGDPPPDTGA